jgi:hypothetical protein
LGDHCRIAGTKRTGVVCLAGVFLALTSIVFNSALFDFFAMSYFPKLTLLIFVAGLSLALAFGSAITGSFLLEIERGR